MISNRKQLNLGLIGEAREMKRLPVKEISCCSNPYQAIRLCTRTKTDAEWAEIFGVTQGYFNSVVNADLKARDAELHGKDYRVRHFPLFWIDIIQRESGLKAISQYFEMEADGDLISQRTTEEELSPDEIVSLYKQGKLRVSV